MNQTQIRLRNIASGLTIEAAYIYTTAFRILTAKNFGSLDDVTEAISGNFPNRNKSSVARIIDSINKLCQADELKPVLYYASDSKMWHYSNISIELNNICEKIVNIFLESEIEIISKSGKMKIEFALNSFSHTIFEKIFKSAFDKKDYKGYDINIVDIRSDEIPEKLDHLKNIDFAFGESIDFDLHRNKFKFNSFDSILLSQEDYIIVSNFINYDSIDFTDVHKLPLIVPDQGTILRYVYESKYKGGGHDFTRDKFGNRVQTLKDNGFNIKMIAPNVNVMLNFVNFSAAGRELCGIISSGVKDIIVQENQISERFPNVKWIPITYKKEKNIKLQRRIFRRSSSSLHFSAMPHHPHNIFWTAARAWGIREDNT